MITGIIIILILIECLQDSQIEPPASESPKKVDWEPDDYKDLSEGDYVKISQKFDEHNYKRFDQDELDELGQLTPHQLNKIGG